MTARLDVWLIIMAAGFDASMFAAGITHRSVESQLRSAKGTISHQVQKNHIIELIHDNPQIFSRKDVFAVEPSAIGRNYLLLANLDENVQHYGRTLGVLITSI